MDQSAGDLALSWSGGKDSALALWALRRANEPVRALLTTVTEDYDRVSMHGVRTTLLRLQAEATGLTLVEVSIPAECTNELYETRMAEALVSAPLRTCRRYAFGDLFLEDVRAYREERLSAQDREGVSPLWGRDTAELSQGFVAAGFKAIVICLDPRSLDASFAGREYDGAFLAELPPDVDPCGERGEFHTFVYDGPVFTEPIPCRRGQIVERAGFVFTDLVPLVRPRPSWRRLVSLHGLQGMDDVKPPSLGVLRCAS